MSGIIPEEKITEVRERASIIEVIGDFVSLRKSGKNFLGLCPFHSEKTPSFTVNLEKGIFHCFGCGAGGNVFNFLMQISHLSFPEAVQEVARRYGVLLPQRELSDEEKRRKSLRSKLFEINEMTAEYYQRMLLSQKEGAEGKKYLAQRGLSEDTIQTHRLGFATAAWDSLAVFLQKQGVPANLAETLGLILPRKENSVAGGRPSYYDRFRHRIMFPIMSEGGRVCGFGGRLIGEAASANGIGSPKYMNSPESPIYSKGHNLYGLHIAKAPIREKGLALIVEGYMDLLSLHQEGFGNTVASLGTSLTPAQVGLLGRYTREAVLIFDGDESGQKATQRSVELFLKGNIAAQVALLPAGYDPDTFIRKEKRDGFERLLAKALPAVEYLLEQARRRYAIGTIEGKVRAVRELVTVLNALQDPLEKNLYVERVASQLGLKEPQVRAQLAGKVEAASELGPVQRKEEFRGSALERMLLQLMLRHNPFIPVVMEGIAPEGFIDPRHQKLAGKLNTLWETRKKVDVQELLERGEDADLKEMISELILTEESIVDADRMLKDCLRKVKLTRVHQEIQRVDEEIRQRSRQEVAAGGAGLKELLKRKQRLIAEQKKWIQDSAAGVTPLAGQ